jgi:DNA-binding transcriptional ArsR family regulator/uncharacterized protein YndB with AHSA1/START domain
VSDRAHIWRALADPTRRDILDLLRGGPRTTGQVCTAFSATRFAVMHHLGVLEAAGLVTVRRRGRERWNYLNAVPLRQELRHWLDPFGDRLAEASIALKRAAETTPRTADDPAADPAAGTVGGATGGATEDGADEKRDGAEDMTEQTIGRRPRVARGEIDTATEIEIDAPRDRVFAALTEVGQWWPHRFREGSAVEFEAHVGGRWYEDWGGGNGALYGIVGALDRPGRLSITGPLGITGPVTGVWEVRLEEAGPGRTVLRGTHRAFGDIDEETEQGYRNGWGEVYSAFQKHLAATVDG